MALNNRRLYQRAPLGLAGRYLHPDGAEFPCKTINVSPTGFMFAAGICPYRGQRVVVYLEKIGRVEGIAVRIGCGYFSIRLNAPDIKRARLINMLTAVLGDATPAGWAQDPTEKSISLAKNPNEAVETFQASVPENERAKRPNTAPANDPVRQYLDFL